MNTIKYFLSLRKAYTLNVRKVLNQNKNKDIEQIQTHGSTHTLAINMDQIETMKYLFITKKCMLSSKL